MKSKKIVLGAWMLILPFLSGAAIWAAVDIFDLYTENQFTGRMRAFDVEYIDAVIGSAFMILARGIIGGLGKWVEANSSTESD